VTFRKVDNQYYNAEVEARVDLMGAFPCVEDAQLYANHIVGRKWYRETFGEFEVEVRYVRRVQVCGTHRQRGKFYIDETLGRLCEGVMIHELGHVPTYVPGLEHRDHGPAFIRAHLLILDHMVMDYYAEQFRVALKKRGFTW
jgi:hypothetical protein